MITTYDLGRPPAAEDRGGDCRARDLAQGRNVHGLHRFATSTDCQINNGMLRVTVGATGVAPSVTIDAFTGYRSIDDLFWDTFDDIFPGGYSPSEWTAMGTLTIDSSALVATLTGVQIARLAPESVTLRLIAAAMADAYLTLRRGESMVRIQHGETRSGTVSIARRIRWADTGLAGAATTGRVTETAPLTNDFARFVGAADAATSNAGAFSVTTGSVTSARFGAGVGTTEYGTTVADLHGQLADASRSALVVV